MADDMIEVVADVATTTSNLRKLPDAVRKELLTVAKILDAELVNHARSLASGDLVGVKSGGYRNSIQGSVTASSDQVVGRAYSRSPLAHIIEEGAKRAAYDILPNSKQALSMTIGGRKLAFAKVHHPATVEQGRHVLERALEDRRGIILAGLSEAMTVGLAKSLP